MGRATDRYAKYNILGVGVKMCAGATTTPCLQTLIVKKVRYEDAATLLQYASCFLQATK